MTRMGGRGQGDDALGRPRRGARTSPSSAASGLPEPGDTVERVTAEVVECRLCPRLVAWREAVAADPPLRHRGETYWARPVPGFGDPAARLLVVGLAPAAHGGNRTGRVFTGDRSGDWLFRALHRAGFANQPWSRWPGDGLELIGCYIAAIVRCAPPANRPTPGERDTCLPYLVREIRALTGVRVVVALGSFAWDGALRALRSAGWHIPSPRPVFGHGAEAVVSSEEGEASVVLLGCYHPSQQNTFTGKLTEGALDAIFVHARTLVNDASPAC